MVMAVPPLVGPESGLTLETVGTAFVAWTLAPVQVDAPPVGLVDVNTKPFWSTAAHREATGHEMSLKLLVPSTLAGVHVDAPPSGLVDVTTSPSWSTAVQREALGHEMPVRELLPS